MKDQNTAKDLAKQIAAGVFTARIVEHPFFHIEFDRVFPEEVYAQMLAAMPVYADFRALPGRNSANIRSDGLSTRVKLDLFPEFIRKLPAQKREIWSLVGKALCSVELEAAFMKKLSQGLERRFGKGFTKTGMYPMPILTRDIPGYRIPPHTDTHWKGITVQFYLPPDDQNIHIGTVFHERKPDGALPKVTRMRFARNTGYAFAVGNDTWHSADPVGSEVKSRDSILLTYFVDQGPLRFLRNRGKRFGNLILNEARALTGKASKPA